MGMSFSFAGFGLLLGSPIAGVILETRAGFTGASAFGAATVMVGFIIMVLAVVAHQIEVRNQ